MDNRFHYSSADYREQVARIAERVVPNVDAIPTVAPRVEFESNSYHAVAIRKAEQARLSTLYPRLHL